MRVLLSVVCASLLAGGVSPLFGQSPLGELARQEEARRRASKGESRVYTNEDLPNVPSPVRPPEAAAQDAAVTDGGATAAAGRGASAAAGAEQPADGAAEPPRDQAYWSGRLAALRETLARNQTYADALQSRINALTTDFVNRDDPIQRSAIAADRDRAVTELERLRKQLVADEQAIRDTQAEGRRAGVPAGWLR